MPIKVIVGVQWGDEGKGRFVDWYSKQAKIVARYAGGDNAGHTVAIGDAVYKMHLLPSGILHEGVTAVMGNGMVINPISLLDEVDRLRGMGVDITPENLKVSSRAHIITPAHIERDKANEIARGKDAIGTTLKGIGPCYLDKIGRKGLRLGDMRDTENFMEQFEQRLEQANATLPHLQDTPLDIKELTQRFLDASERLKDHIVDTSIYLNDALMAGDGVVCEGAQGTLLDVDHGSYPFVTSSSPTIGGAITGLGVGPRHIQDVVGVAKAFSTRVGSGPMPTELFDDVADKLRGTGENFWDEFGTTTGRPRRCGWLDVVMLRYAVVVNGLTELTLTKLDILSGLGDLKLAVAYEVDGERMDYPPVQNDALERATPIYETMAGWDEDVSSARTTADLPEATRAYIQRISDIVGVPVRMVSVGPERDQVVHLD